MSDEKKDEYYLSITANAAKMLAKCLMAIFQGKEKVNFAAFKYENGNEKAPKYKNSKDEIGVWINKKKKKTNKIEEEVVKED